MNNQTANQAKPVGGASERIRQAWRKIRQNICAVIKGAIEELIFLTDRGSDAPDAAEAAHRAKAAAAIRDCLGERPANALVQMTPEGRAGALVTLHAAVATALEMEPSVVSIEEMNGLAGCYSFHRDTLCVSAASVNKQPLTLGEAKELLDTLCHETYHAFQRRAIVRPSRCGISKADARIWRINFKNYISARENPARYWWQPVEISARLFAADVVNSL